MKSFQASSLLINLIAAALWSVDSLPACSDECQSTITQLQRRVAELEVLLSKCDSPISSEPVRSNEQRSRHLESVDDTRRPVAMSETEVRTKVGAQSMARKYPSQDSFTYGTSSRHLLQHQEPAPTASSNCTVRINTWPNAEPSKFCMAHDVIRQVTGCKINWMQDFESGMAVVDKLESEEIDIAVVGSSPATIALSAPRVLPVEVIALQYQNAETAGLLVRSSIRSPSDLQGSPVPHMHVRAHQVIWNLLPIASHAHSMQGKLSQHQAVPLHTTSFCTFLT